MRYRIVKDRYCGYGIQYWCWWWPFWLDMGPTCITIEHARHVIDAWAGVVVENYDPHARKETHETAE